MARRTIKPESAREALSALRAKLDETDREILTVLRRRLDQVREVAQVKRSGASFLRDQQREAELLSRVEAQARELGLDPFRAREVFREVIAMSLKVQEEALLRRESAARSARHWRRVAYQGAEGSYS